MSVSLLSEATVHLFGDEVVELTVTAGFAGSGKVAAAMKALANPKIARVYAFAFQNEYVELASPALFVVSGGGTAVPSPATLAGTGLSVLPNSLNPGLKFWTVERDDVAVRLDVMTGTYSRVLLDYELADSGLQDFARGGEQLGRPTAVTGASRAKRRRWRPDDE